MSSSADTEKRQAATVEKLTPLAALMGIAIEAMTIAALWGNRRALVVSVVVFVAMMGLSVWMNVVLIKRWGPRKTELLRLVLSVIAAVATNHYTHWPAPTWLWLPYYGLATDGDRKWNWIALAAMALPLDIVAVHDGARLLRPAFFTFLAIASRAFTDARMDVLKKMFEESEARRAELDRAHERLRAETAAREAMESQLRQSQKLEAVGRLASGIAHEINTPVQFVSDSTSFLSDAVAAFIRAIRAEEKLTDEQRAEQLEDLEFMIKEAPQALELMNVGLERIAAIVRSMRQVAHGDTQKLEPLDVNQAVKTAVTLATNECKRVADVELSLADVERVVCCGGEVLQVLLNLIVNAADAIEETGRRGVIRVSTRQHDRNVVIEVADTGAGIPDHAREHVFEPFFTTKRIGKGTGQGLAIARGVVARHGGTLTFETSAKGTTFKVDLPTSPPSASQAA